MIAHQEMDTKESSRKRYKIVVRSAEEAVRLIREKLGDKAKVVSVRQVGGEGLKRFISSPKLEVIAEVGSPGEESEGEKTEEKPTFVDLSPPSISSINQSNKLPSVTTEVTEEKRSITPGDHETTVIASQKSISSLLSKAGFDNSLLSYIQSWSNWEKLKELPLADALKEITVGLSDRFRSLKSEPLRDSVAILGSPSVGKTTTLCKLLAHEVFIGKKKPMVLKVENGVPNPDDSLRIFCDVIGVTLYREAHQVPSQSANSPLYIDYPGLNLSGYDNLDGTSSNFSLTDIESKLLVINGAYDSALLSRSIGLGKHLGATHLCISHFDELINANKLWLLILNAGLSPYCICNGQNITGDLTKGVLNQLIAKTFPQELYGLGFSAYQKGLSDE